MLQAALLFWLPLALIPVSIWISQSKKSTNSKTNGIILLVIGLVLVLASPWTVPQSPSSAVGHLFGFIVGPSILVLFGLFMVAFSGIIGFVGLMIPHIVRMFVGGDYLRVLPLSALLGAIFILWADIVARTIMPPEDMPIGIVTGLAGGIFFVWLLRRK